MSDHLPEGVKALRDVTETEEYQLCLEGTWFHGTMKKHPSWDLGRFVLVRPRRDLWVATGTVVRCGGVTLDVNSGVTADLAADMATAKNVADLLNKAAGT